MRGQPLRLRIAGVDDGAEGRRVAYAWMGGDE